MTITIERAEIYTSRVIILVGNFMFQGKHPMFLIFRTFKHDAASYAEGVLGICENASPILWEYAVPVVLA